ncbi:hypothetical protein CONLIGDRAFT_276828 [Coniochaeta ligniaria NRRL 30616]|uniref:Chitin-binding type-1 domain-containing protein n=1 Tax=Coniochaeta ligniaria NRRL 30616 TaxID=1408157 RepID=A0A1J7IZ03_9PEZI|nr:hypothetical protein CONLIGDRAFT_276828 [Coniochaeta ligniaria NRRL 30616]
MLLNIGSSRLLSFALCGALWTSSTVASNECKPHRWSYDTNGDMVPVFAAVPSAMPSQAAIQPGEINCRLNFATSVAVNSRTCTELADNFGTRRELFFVLNPALEPDCSNIQPLTEYCVIGFIEPLRAWDGLCGPPHGGATCLGTDAQCCNAETFTCGDTDEDCADGTCYEGDCLGDIQYGTDGTCGYQHGDRICAGKWGNCCSMDGECGTGPAFCGTTTCQSGDCDWKSGFSSREAV